MRLIDADSFLGLLNHVVYDFFEVCHTNGMLTNRARVGYDIKTIEEALRQTKTVDAVPVVRCKDCVHFGCRYKRLCNLESAETRELVKMMCKKVIEVCPEFKGELVPMCVRNGGKCHEMFSCGERKDDE